MYVCTACIVHADIVTAQDGRYQDTRTIDAIFITDGLDQEFNLHEYLSIFKIADQFYMVSIGV